MFDGKPGTTRNLTHALMAGLVGCTLLAGCKKTTGNAQALDPNAPDPAAANLAPVDPNQPQSYQAPAQGAYPAQRGVVSQTPPQPPRTRVLGQSQSTGAYQQGESYGQQQPAPIERAPEPQNDTPLQQYGNNPPAQSAYPSAYQRGDQNFDQTIDQYAEEAPQPPPPLPVYEQPPAPEPNYLWTPGYWSYAPTGYFWVPGAWCAPPYSGALWTPGYWGYTENRYRFHRGFWGLHIGFYGGIPYGFGYTGHGYEGGYWRGNDFYYNRAVNRVNETVIRNTYVRNVTINNTTINNTVVNNRVSYNGPGGAQARPAAYEVAAMREQHAPPQAAQVQLHEQAAGDRRQFYTQNHGQPVVTVAQRPLVADRGVPAPQRQQFAASPPAQPGTRPGTGTFGQQPQPANGVPQRSGSMEQQRFGGQPGQPQRSGEPPRPGQLPPQTPSFSPQPGQHTLIAPQHNQPQNGGVPLSPANQAGGRQFEQRTQSAQPTPPQRQDSRPEPYRRPYQPGEQQHGQTNPQPEQRTQPVQPPQIQSQPQQPRSQFGQPREPQQNQQKLPPASQPQVRPRQLQPQEQPQLQQRVPPSPQPRTQPQPFQQRAPQPEFQQRTPQQPRLESQQPRPQPQPIVQPHAEAPHAPLQARPHEEHSPR